MPDTLTAQIAESVVEMVTTTLELIPHKAVMPNLAIRKTIAKGHDRVEIPRVNSTSAVQTPTEGDELVISSQFDLTSTTIQPTHRAIMVRVHERATYFSKDDVIQLVSEEMSQTQAQDMDQDLLAEFSNLTRFTAATAGIGGGTTVNLVASDLRASRRLLLTNPRSAGGPAPGRIYAVLGPMQEEDLFTDLGAVGVGGVTITNAPQVIPAGISQEVLLNYHIPQNAIAGMTLFRDGYMTEDANGDSTIGIFSEKALYLAIAKDWDMKVFEVPNWLGVILRSTADYNSGVGGYPAYGGNILVDGE
jgi:hypothetical protein